VSDECEKVPKNLFKLVTFFKFHINDIFSYLLNSDDCEKVPKNLFKIVTFSNFPSIPNYIIFRYILNSDDCEKVPCRYLRLPSWLSVQSVESKENRFEDSILQRIYSDDWTRRSWIYKGNFKHFYYFIKVVVLNQ
jgi:hypothetical protein